MEIMEDQVIEPIVDFRKKRGNPNFASVQHKLKPGEKMEPVLNNDQRVFALKLFAEGMGSKEIVENLKEAYGVDYKEASLRSMVKSNKWQTTIDRFREEYYAKVKAVPIANKRVRLDDLEKTRLKILKCLESNPMKTKADRAEFLMMTRRLNETICVSREEMESKPLMVQQLSLTSLSNLSDEELQRRKDDLIAKATGTYQRRNTGIGDADEGEVFQDNEESA